MTSRLAKITSRLLAVLAAVVMLVATGCSADLAIDA